MAREPGALAHHPRDQLLDQRSDLPLSHRPALGGRQSVDGALRREHGVELLHRRERNRRDDGRAPAARPGCDICKLEELAARMSPARRFGDRTRLALGRIERVEPTIGVGLQYPRVAGEMSGGMRALAIG